MKTVMRTAFHRLPVALAIAVLAGSLGGCGTVNGWLAAGFEDYIPAWAGGLPADAPPRPGTLKYDEWMRERERQRLEAATRKDESGPSASSSLGPLH
jgi:hypothetical protein